MRGREAAAAPAEKAIESETKAAQEEQRRQIARHERTDSDGNVHCAIAARKILNHGREQHVKQTAPHQASLRWLGRARLCVLRAAFGAGKGFAA